jgi:hypothetical protein
MFEQKGFHSFGAAVTMALFLQNTCVFGSLLQHVFSRGAGEPEPPPRVEQAAKELEAPAVAEPGGAQAGSGAGEAAAEHFACAFLLTSSSCFALLGLGIAVGNALGNGSLAYVSQPVKARSVGPFMLSTECRLRAARTPSAAEPPRAGAV